MDIGNKVSSQPPPVKKDLFLTTVDEIRVEVSYSVREVVDIELWSKTWEELEENIEGQVTENTERNVFRTGLRSI